ncbi:MAG: TetR/AcrR family transcriptional regulator [Propionibacteriales bacterium]|nr:TetR/AcrR family transcriptional regulator [Propionibacteriales bacterium]
MTSPPLTRAEQKKLELRRDIIEAAFDVFAEKGYHATGIADIAARLGIGHGTFYRYFENKRDIVEHVVDDLIGRIVGALADENAPDAVDTLEDYRAQTARIGLAFGRIALADPRIPQMVILQAPGIDPAMGERIQDFFATAEGLTAKYLERGVSLGYLRPDLDVAGTSVAINGMILGSLLAAIRNPDAGAQERLSEAIRRVMYDGISA